MKRSRPMWLIASLMLTAAMFLTACGGPTTPATQSSPVPIVTSALTTSVPPTLAPPTDAPTPDVLRPTPSSTPMPRAEATATAPPAVISLECKAGAPWSQTRTGVTLAICFDPYPPQLGSPATFEAMLTDTAGQPIADATVKLTLVGGMAGMEGEHDEEFAVQLGSQGSGWYVVQATVGSSDLVLTGVSIEVRTGGQSWLFSVSADKLRAP